MDCLQGDLSVLGLGNLLQALVSNRSAGVLTLEAGLEHRVLRVSPAGIRLVRGSSRCHEIERLLRGAPGDETPPPFLRPDAASRLMNEWMTEEICELLAWTRGTFRFHPFFDPARQQEAGPFAAYGKDLDVPPLVLRAARRAEETARLKAAIPDLQAVPAWNGARTKERLDGEAMGDVVRLVDGRRPVLQILQQTVLPRFIALKVLHRLLREEIVSLELPSRLALAA